MIRAAIYARFSDEKQNARSVDDQIDSCRDVTAREGFAVARIFKDRAISGSSTLNRPGFLAMMRAAEARAFDVIVVEDVDRISRDQGDWHTARKRLDFLGIAIHTATGKVGKIDGALRAMMGEMFLENLALHTRRGLESVIRAGRHAGGRAYGYAPVPGKAGELAVIEAEAEIVRRIFRDYAGGRSPRDIAAALNAAEIPPPRKTTWNASTINGNLQRGAGILLNDLYAGRIVWNKVRMIKDPATGKRISRPNPPDQHRQAEAPHLRIVPDQLWQAVQARKRAAGSPHTSGPKTRRILSGLIRCGACGGVMVSQGNRHGTARLQCASYIESGTCANGRRVKRDAIERLGLDGLRRELAEPAYLAEYVTAYNAERRRLASDAGNARGTLEKRRGAIEREIARAIDAIVRAGVDPATLAPRIRQLETERGEIEAQLAALDRAKDVIALHPAALDRYRADLDRLAALLPHNAIGESDDLAAALRALISAVIVHAPPGSERLEIEIRGNLDELLAAPTFMRRSAGGSRVVAGGRYRRTPPGQNLTFSLKMTAR